jgi:NAD-dependent deacetylase
MEDPIQRAAEDLAEARHAVAATGAGMSVESKIPPFRGKGGLWEKIDPMEFAHIDSFLKDPAKVWGVLIREMKDIIDRAAPNPAHLGLAELERMGVLKSIITQNVDGLHQKAGNTDVIEFHGNFVNNRCLDCSEIIDVADIVLETLPPRCRCGGVLKPEVVFFGEMIPYEALRRARAEAAACDVMLVIGTSGTVQPAASMPWIARESGATIIEVNIERTHLTGAVSHYIAMGPAGETVRRIVEEVRRIKEKT